MKINIMKNGFVTDVFYFRLNRKTEQKKYSAFTVTILIFTILIAILPIVYSLPDNEIELPKDVSNDLKNGLIKADNFVTNGFIHDNKSYNNDDGFKPVQRRKGGKHHHKKLHSRKHTKTEHNDEYNSNNNTNQLNSKYKYIHQGGNKFDYYPIEPVNISYDPKEDDKIRFELITGDDEEKKFTKNENKKKRRRHKRDVSNIKQDDSVRSKRNLILPAVLVNHNNQLTAGNLDNKIHGLPSAGIRFIKFAIPGIYHNAITPFKPTEPNVISRLPEIDDRPVWDRKPIINSIPSGGKEPTRNPTTQRHPTRLPITQSPQPLAITTTYNPEIKFQIEQNDTIGTGRSPDPTPPSTGPSNCIWAIVNCCSKSNENIRYGCFEKIGCVGAFWDFNPCGDSWQKQAVEQADKFFDEDDDYDV